MNKKEIFLKIGILPTIFFIIGLTLFISPYLYNEYGYIRRDLSPFEIISGFFGFFVFPKEYFSFVSSEAQRISLVMLIIFSCTLYFFIRFIFFLINYDGFPSMEEAKKYYREKKFLEKKKRLHLAKLMHEARLQKLDEEKKKFL